ncbi:6528_t:CDS:2 [Entrophospora sp. SA101]|nr:6528_t:CDS:2 [Entrophospora sp. SA101]
MGLQSKKPFLFGAVMQVDRIKYKGFGYIGPNILSSRPNKRQAQLTKQKKDVVDKIIRLLPTVSKLTLSIEYAVRLTSIKILWAKAHSSWEEKLYTTLLDNVYKEAKQEIEYYNLVIAVVYDEDEEDNNVIVVSKNNGGNNF